MKNANLLMNVLGMNHRPVIVLYSPLLSFTSSVRSWVGADIDTTPTQSAVTGQTHSWRGRDILGGATGHDMPCHHYWSLYRKVTKKELIGGGEGIGFWRKVSW